MMKKNAFTLIELLVVIAIIASIVGLALPNYLSARERARDSKKKSEMRELKAALRLYYNDFNNYPADDGLGHINGCGVGGAGPCPCSSTVDFASGATCDNLFMKKLPSDVGVGTYYFQGANGEDFCLSTLLDNKSDQDIAVSQSRCASVCGVNCNTAGRFCTCAD